MNEGSDGGKLAPVEGETGIVGRIGEGDDLVPLLDPTQLDRSDPREQERWSVTLDALDPREAATLYHALSDANLACHCRSCPRVSLRVRPPFPRRPLRGLRPQGGPHRGRRAGEGGAPARTGAGGSSGDPRRSAKSPWSCARGLGGRVGARDAPRAVRHPGHRPSRRRRRTAPAGGGDDGQGYARGDDRRGTTSLGFPGMAHHEPIPVDVGYPPLYAVVVEAPRLQEAAEIARQLLGVDFHLDGSPYDA